MNETAFEGILSSPPLVRIDLVVVEIPSGFRLTPLKEVIQPQVPLRLPCYDFTPVIDHTIGGFLPCGLEHRLPVQ